MFIGSFFLKKSHFFVQVSSLPTRFQILIEEKYTETKKCSGQFPVNAWGWISFYGPGLCWNIDGGLNSEEYIIILENRLVPFANATNKCMKIINTFSTR